MEACGQIEKTVQYNIISFFESASGVNLQTKAIRKTCFHKPLCNPLPTWLKRKSLVSDPSLGWVCGCSSFKGEVVNISDNSQEEEEESRYACWVHAGCQQQC